MLCLGITADRLSPKSSKNHAEPALGDYGSGNAMDCDCGMKCVCVCIYFIHVCCECTKCVFGILSMHDMYAHINIAFYAVSCILVY